MENRTGHLQTYQRDIVRLNLLPRKEVSVTAQGIHFGHQLYYTCEIAEREGWFARARIKGSWKISVAYHPNSTKYIYLPIINGMDVEVCELTPASKDFAGSDFYSVEHYNFEEAIASENARDRVYKSDAEFNARHKHITEKAQKQTDLAKFDAGKQSKKSQLEGIRNNRAEERDYEREANIWTLGVSDLAPETSVSAIPKQSEEEYISAPDYTDVLGELLNQHQHQDKNIS